LERLLFVDSDDEMLDCMGTYLSWYGYRVEKVRDSSEVITHLTQDEYDLLICGVFAQPLDGYMLSNMIRRARTPSIRRLKMILVAAEEPELEKYVMLKKLGVFFMLKYADARDWRQKIKAVLKDKELSIK